MVLINQINWEPLATQDEIQGHSACLASPCCLHTRCSSVDPTPGVEHFQRRSSLLSLPQSGCLRRLCSLKAQALHWGRGREHSRTFVGHERENKGTTNQNLGTYKSAFKFFQNRT